MRGKGRKGIEGGAVRNTRRNDGPVVVFTTTRRDPFARFRFTVNTLGNSNSTLTLRLVLSSPIPAIFPFLAPLAANEPPATPPRSYRADTTPRKNHRFHPRSSSSRITFRFSAQLAIDSCRKPICDSKTKENESKNTYNATRNDLRSRESSFFEKLNSESSSSRCETLDAVAEIRFHDQRDDRSTKRSKFPR